MSYQHFYSRVPARVSLYNKRDSFDTFAHSLGMEDSFIRGELSKVYYDKLRIHDPLKVRRGEIPTVYSQLPLSTGELVHTAIGYIPSDFTGERSAYLSHSLVLTEEERESVMRSPASDCFNTGMFITDISRFNLTSPNGAPNPRASALPYRARAIADHKATLSAYTPEMMRHFIYAIISAVCQGTPDVYFRLPVGDRYASDRALSMICAVMSLLPYSIRERLSYVSFVSTPDAYQGFKLKCVSSDCEDIPVERGIFFDFSTGRINGTLTDYTKNSAMAAFFYSLLDYPAIREAFLPFVARIEASSGRPLTVSSLREIVFLFWQCSGFYVEDTVVPNDESFCNLLDVYESYRIGLEPSHRVRVYRPLERYYKSHTQIPDGVFSRVSRLYPDECIEAKAAALELLLKLIHLDLMRDSIFCFISRNYNGETEEKRALISENLARVFYGGFLQNAILVFFDAHFRTEPVTTRDNILDKLLLSIRTPEIQRQIVVFLDRHYSAMNAAQRMKVCNVCLEMIPECDMLSALLVSLVNRRIGGRDGGDLAALVGDKLTEILGYSLSRGDGRLAAIFVENIGFCEELCLRYVLNSGAGVDILAAILAAMPAHKRGDKLIRAFKLSNSPIPYIEFITKFAVMPVVVAPSGLKELLRLDRSASIALPSDILSHFRERVIYPVIAYTFADAFKAEYGKEGLVNLINYAEANPIVKGLPQYRLILDYLALVRKCSLGDTEGAFKIAVGIPVEGGIRQNMGEYISSYGREGDNLDEEAECSFSLVISFLSKGEFGFDRLYSKYSRHYEEEFVEEGGIAALNAERRGASAACALILSAASEICEASDILAKYVVAETSGLKGAIADFIAIYGFGAGQFLKKHTRDAYYGIEEIAEELIEERNASINSPRDAVDIILGKGNINKK